MKVVLLAGGYGTRISEETDIRPKPMVDNMGQDSDYRVVGDLPNTDKIMNDSFWIGFFPGMGDGAIKYMVDIIRNFILKQK